jgi:glycosyltransferase involved in cell wall biosynthesis
MADTKKILMLNYEFPPLGGGAANVTAYVLREFARDRDIFVDLITSSTGSGSIAALSENITIHYVDIGKRGSLHYQTCRDLLAYAWQAWRRGRDLVAAHSYDLCHAFFGIPCGYVARRLGLPYVVSLQGSDVPFYNERFKRLDRLFFKRMSIRIWADAVCVTANSKALRELALTSAPNQPIEVVYNGVDTDAFHPAVRDGGGLRAICVARLIQRKGIEYLIRAMAELRDLDVRLTIVGTGNEEANLRALARREDVEHMVRFAGFVHHEEVARLYGESDVFVLPSLNEGMSLTVLEAMACGLPIVMTDTGGAAELVRDGQSGFLVEKRSASDVAARLRRYLSEPGLLARHGGESRRTAESLTWGRIAEAYRRLYLRI